MDKGYKIISDGTDNHSMLIDLRKKFPELTRQGGRKGIGSRRYHRKQEYGSVRQPFGIKKEAEGYMAELNEAIPEEKDKLIFYRSIVLVCDGIVRLANRYAEKAREMAAEEKDEARKAELLEIAATCEAVPENPPKSFREAIQFTWFVQLGGIISENPLALNPGRFDQYIYPYYKADLDAGKIDYDTALELIECLWLKYSEWAWTISANTADFFAGYTNFENLTVGGTTKDGQGRHK